MFRYHTGDWPVPTFFAIMTIIGIVFFCLATGKIDW